MHEYTEPSMSTGSHDQSKKDRFFALVEKFMRVREKTAA